MPLPREAGVELFGLELWGTPWQPWFIVICHGPPRGYGDRNGQPVGQPHVGSPAMTQALERIQARLMVGGHIHPGYGRYQLGATEIVNAALVDNAQELVNPVVEITR